MQNGEWKERLRGHGAVKDLHVGVAGAHVLIEGGLDEGEGFGEVLAVVGFAGFELVGGGGVAVLREGDEGFGGEGLGVGEEVFGGCVEVLGVAGVY